MKKADFIDYAYKLFPKGVNYDDIDEYMNTKEIKFLSAEIQKGKKNNKIFFSFLEKMKRSQIETAEVGIDEKLQRTFRIGIISDASAPHYLMLYISKIIPYYCFSVKSDNISQVEAFNTRKFNAFNMDHFSEKTQKTIEVVSKIIERSFPGYKRFSPTFMKTVVEDIEFFPSF